MLAPEVHEFLEEGTYWVRDFIPGHDPEPGAVDVHLSPLDD